MDIRDRRALKESANQVLGAAEYPPRRLVLLHTGAMLLLSLLLTVVNFALQKLIDGAGGLSGIGTRTMLSTAQSVLNVLGAVILPFWQMGYLFAAIRTARRQQASPLELTEGFRRFGPILRLSLLKGALFLGLGIACFYLCSGIFFFTPFAAPVLPLLEPLINTAPQDAAMLLDEAAMAAIVKALIPLYVIFAVIYAAVALPMYYRLRMADYVIMDGENHSALLALRDSWRMMRGSRAALLRIDLSFWWYYGLEALTVLVCYADVLLGLTGITLPISADAAYFLCFALSLTGQLGLYYWAKAKTAVTYAAAYDSLRFAQPPQPKPVPKNLPWN